MNQSIGQLFLTGISGLSLRDFEKVFIKDEEIGGVLLFSKNYESRKQLAALVNEIQSLRGDLPLFIAVDHEGGRVQRFKSEFTHFPALKNIADTNSPKLCFEVHQQMAHELLACGVNTNFAPCADILTNEECKVIGDRSFSSDPDVCAKFISSAIRGLETNGVYSCAKHFPGHGDTFLDSHEELPRITRSIEDVRKRELVPFLLAAKSKTSFFMMAHLLFEDLDKELPTSLSEKAYSFLRNELRYEGIIVTDDMEMGAIEKNYSVSESSVMALDAGADILEYRSMEKTQEALNSVKVHANKNNDFLKKLVAKVERVNLLKKSKLLNYRPLNLLEAANKEILNDGIKLINRINLMTNSK